MRLCSDGDLTSHALCLDRVYGVHYAVGIFTNLTQDHLDFHVTMENYCDAKAILFRNCGVGVVNGDDPWTPRLLKDATCQVRTYGVKSESPDLRAETRCCLLTALPLALGDKNRAEYPSGC
ncbi:MAG: Mur ligase family protein [Dysosmobacter sp.]